MRFHQITLGIFAFSLASLGLAADSPPVTAPNTRAEPHREHTADGHTHAAITKMSQQEIAQGRLFLAENAKKPGVITLSSGLQYSVLTPGAGKTPTLNDRVLVNFSGHLVNGNALGHSVRDGRPGATEHRVKDLVPGLREALLHMKEGDRWTVYVPPSLGFPRGSRALEQRVLIYELELLAVQAPVKS